MIELPDGKISRTLPEQVGKNAKDISDIKKVIKDLDLLDNFLYIDDINRQLTLDELRQINQPICFLIYNNIVFIKRSVSELQIDFESVFKLEIGLSLLDFTSHAIIVTIATGQMSYSTASARTYQSSRIDNMLAAKANLNGADFTGAVTAPTLRQSQFNFSREFTLVTFQSLTIENVYNRFAEINNILHLIVNFTITNNTGETKTLGSGYGLVGLATVTLDSSVASKLVDIDGKKASESNTNSTLISSEPCQVLKTKILENSAEFYTGRFSLVNRNTVNEVSVQVALNGGSGNRITIADGESLYITARMALTLI